MTDFPLPVVPSQEDDDGAFPNPYPALVFKSTTTKKLIIITNDGNLPLDGDLTYSPEGYEGDSMSTQMLRAIVFTEIRRGTQYRAIVTINIGLRENIIQTLVRDDDTLEFMGETYLKDSEEYPRNLLPTPTICLY